MEIVSGEKLTAIEKAKAGKISDCGIINKLYKKLGVKNPNDYVTSLLNGEAYIVKNERGAK